MGAGCIRDFQRGHNRKLTSYECGASTVKLKSIKFQLQENGNS